MNLFDWLFSSIRQKNRVETTFNKDSQEVQTSAWSSWVMSWFLTSQVLPLTAKITMQAAATSLFAPTVALQYKFKPGRDPPETW